MISLPLLIVAGLLYILYYKPSQAEFPIEEGEDNWYKVD